MNQDNRTITNEANLNEIVDISLGKKKNVILDATVLTSLMACPRLTDLRFNHNLVSIGGKSNSLECGSIVHVFMEYYYRYLIQGLSKEKAAGFGFSAAELYIRGCKGCADFIPSTCSLCNGSGQLYNNLLNEIRPCVDCDGKGKIIKPECGHKPNEFPGVVNTPKDSAGYKTGWQWVLDTCDQYLAFYRNDHWVPLEVETVKGEVLYEDEEIRVLWKAKLDLTIDNNQGIYSVDHKTMKQRRDTLSLNNQFIGQCLIMRTRNVIINKIGFQAGLKPEEKFTRPPVSYSAARLLEWQSETLPFYSKLLLMYAETGHFPPNYTSCESKYGNCAFVDVCQSDPNMREDEIRRSFKVGPSWDPTNIEE